MGDGELATSEMLGIVIGRLSSLGLIASGGPGCNLLRSGLPAGDFGLASLVGVGRLDSLVFGLWPSFGLGRFLLGDPTMVLGVAAFLNCGGLAKTDSSPLRTSYGPAVLGRGGIAGRLTGRTGAPDNPPAFGRVPVDGAVVEPGALDVPETVRIGRGGENSIAEPGLGREASMAEPGRDIAALCALIVSLIEGLVPIVLRENPKPGRTAGSDAGGALGLFGSRSSSFRAVPSRLSMILMVWLV